MITLIIIISIVVWLCLDRSPEKQRERDTIIYGEDKACMFYHMAVAKKELKKQRGAFRFSKTDVQQLALSNFKQEKGYDYKG